MTKLYRCEIPLRLAVEADTLEEARATMERLWCEVMECLPTGAGVFAKEHVREAHLKAHVHQA